MKKSLRWILKESWQRELRAAEEEEGKYGSFSTDYQFVEVPFITHTPQRSDWEGIDVNKKIYSFNFPSLQRVLSPL